MSADRSLLLVSRARRSLKLCVLRLPFLLAAIAANIPISATLESIITEPARDLHVKLVSAAAIPGYPAAQETIWPTAIIMMMKRLFILIALLLATSATAFSADVTARVEIDYAEPGETIYIRLLLETDTPVAALRVPITMESSWITLEEVSWLSSEADPGEFWDTTNLSNTNRTDWINVLTRYELPFPTIDPPGGEICRFYITIDPDAPEGFIPIDTWTDQYSWVDASDALGNTLEADFIPGGIWVQHSSTAVEDELATLPTEFSLAQNRPNPFNPTTTIEFSLPRPSDVSLTVYDILGNEVAVLAGGRYPAGNHSLEWNAAAAPSGVYFYRLRADEALLTRKMVLLK